MRIVVLFNLKSGVDPADYEAWVRGTDYPGTRALSSVENFTTYRTRGTLGGGDAPYDYVEVIDITTMDAFMMDVATDAVQQLAARFREFAEDPHFIMTEAV